MKKPPGKKVAKQSGGLSAVDAVIKEVYGGDRLTVKKIKAIDARARVQARIDHICTLMRNVKWIRGVTSEALAKEWGISIDRMRELSAEASRIVRAEVVDPDAVTETVTTTLADIMRSAHDQGDHKSAVAAARAWADITGASSAIRVRISEEKPSGMSDERLKELANEAIAVLKAAVK